jgi:hypothetical protein
MVLPMFHHSFPHGHIKRGVAKGEFALGRSFEGREIFRENVYERMFLQKYL